MERSFAVVAGFEHEAELLVGLDDLRDITDHTAPKTSEAVYTETVLKLDGGTYDIIDGQEGFLDNIKRGASKVYEWIKSIIKAIKEWLFGKPRREVIEVQRSITKTSIDLDKLIDHPTEMSLPEVTIEKSIEESKIQVAQRIKALNAIKKVQNEDRKIINETVIEHAPLVEHDRSEKLINEMGVKLTSRLDSVAKNIEEIERVDPEQIISKELGIDKFLILYSKTGISGSKVLLSFADTKTINLAAERIVKIAREFDTALVEATKRLEKMNSEGPFGVEDERSRQVSRAAKVVVELGNAANKMRDLVLTLDSQLLKTAGQIETAEIKARLTEAMKHTSEASNQYLQMALDAL
ncbi:hypothetical protein AH04_246 [Erwinia phage AH04]|uniref:Uncharacterized protein n=1 Tax=Erwinia phage AH04 TaxID=2869569 RepID=A0AAE7X1S5_9CAUD|nr:hypothetical protein PQC02_gp068 [Erwinia phage AH04]QZA70719.1 hypothetical protein AH04_246 [Erwinia phage AH04]